MADKKSVGHAYNIDFLNVVFAASSIFMFVTTIMMVWDDYDREWKDYQRRFVQLEREVTQASLVAAQGVLDPAEVEQLRTERAQAAAELEASRAQVDELESQLDGVEALLYTTTQEYQGLKAVYDVERYEYEELVDQHPEDAEAERPRIEEMYEEWLALGLDVERQTAERDGIRDEISAFTMRVTEVDAELRALTGEVDRLSARVDDLQPSLVNDLVFNAPLLDFMAPTITVRQVITPNIVDDVNFTRVAKMDRCTTCHLAIDREGYEDYPQPFRTHSNLDAYVGSASPHPVQQYGCTVCHEGMGQSISFKHSSHTPGDLHVPHMTGDVDAHGEHAETSGDQTRAWKSDLGWEEPHLWDYPMLPTEMTEASCGKCHGGSVYVPEGPKLSEAYGLYERAGCYACHKSEGFEGLRNPGPDLTKISSKLEPEWVARWIRDPRAVKASTWMPRVWYNSNTSDPEDVARNEAEIDSVVAYLFENSEDHEFAVPDPRSGDAANGQQLVESVGCLACHITGDETRVEAGPRRTFGQPLQNIGNKTTYEWLYDWVRDPKHFSPDTYMPDMRLTEDEVRDVASYLVTLRGANGIEAPGTYTESDVTEALTDYYRAIVPTDEAVTTVAAMSSEEQKLELGRRVIGRYGCYSCHTISGFEDAQPIGIELSEEGTKLLPRFDFAFLHHEIPHMKVEWFKQKLRAPRSWDRSRELQPLEKLRMPNFGFSEEEVTLLTTAIMSFQSEVQPVASQMPRSARNDALDAGRNLSRRRNCISCHEIEDVGGEYQELVGDPALAPPLLTPEGAKVRPEWLYAFFRAPIPIRPWLDVRMPSFHLEDHDWNTALDYFGAVSDAIGPFRTHDASVSREVIDTGEELFDLLRCQQCHVLDSIPDDQPTDNLAPDLRMARERLQPDWIVDWLVAPLDIQPGTRMPMFWTEYPGSFYPQFDQDAIRQIESVRDYLLTFSGGPSPLTGN
tara:strand:- start:16223 stop:19111 length:2889 start_codon:yes stop_codon:yes gene_type:complete